MTTTHATHPFAVDRRPARRPRRHRPHPRRRSRPGPAVEILDVAGFRDGLIDRLIATAVFGEGPERDAARWVIRVAAPALGAWPASIHALYMAAGRGEYANRTAPAINVRGLDLRHHARHLPRRARQRLQDRALRAGPLRDVLHPAATRRVRQQRAGGGDQGGAPGTGLHPGRPLPDQRQELRRRPGPRAGRPARADRRGDRGRVLQHRHRCLDHRRRLAADAGRAAGAQRAPDGDVHRAHPGAGAGRGDRLRRRRDRRGRTAQLDGGGAARLHDRLHDRAAGAGATAAARPGGDLQDQRPDRHLARRRRPAGRHDRRRRGRFRDAEGSSPRWRASTTGWAARCSTAPRRCRRSRSGASRRRTRSRSTWRPPSRTRSSSTPPSRPI